METVLGGAFLAVIAYGVGRVLWEVRAYSKRVDRELRRHRRRTLADLPEDTLARVVGKAVSLDETLEAPLSGRRCVYYTAIVEVADGNGWKELVRVDRAVMFVLDDGTARAIVDPSRSDMKLDFDAKSTSGTFDNPTAREKAFLDEHRIASTRVAGLFNRSLRYTEAAIEVGETIAIVGGVTREPDPDAPPEAAYRGDTPTRLRMTSSRKQPMIISDRPAATT